MNVIDSLLEKISDKCKFYNFLIGIYGMLYIVKMKYTEWEYEKNTINRTIICWDTFL